VHCKIKKNQKKRNQRNILNVLNGKHTLFPEEQLIKYQNLAQENKKLPFSMPLILGNLLQLKMISHFSMKNIIKINNPNMKSLQRF